MNNVLRASDHVLAVRVVECRVTLSNQWIFVHVALLFLRRLL
jgi:hypothetical protein